MALILPPTPPDLCLCWIPIALPVGSAGNAGTPKSHDYSRSVEHFRIWYSCISIISIIGHSCPAFPTFSEIWAGERKTDKEYCIGIRKCWKCFNLWLVRKRFERQINSVSEILWIHCSSIPNHPLICLLNCIVSLFSTCIDIVFVTMSLPPKQ